jgi:hypothetical protein
MSIGIVEVGWRFDIPVRLSNSIKVPSRFGHDERVRNVTSDISSSTAGKLRSSSGSGLRPIAKAEPHGCRICHRDADEDQVLQPLVGHLRRCILHENRSKVAFSGHH